MKPAFSLIFETEQQRDSFMDELFRMQELDLMLERKDLVLNSKDMHTATIKEKGH